MEKVSSTQPTALFTTKLMVIGKWNLTFVPKGEEFVNLIWVNKAFHASKIKSNSNVTLPVASQGSEVIEDTVDYSITSSSKAEIPHDFDAAGTVHLHLLPSAGSTDRFVDISLSAQIVLSGLRFELLSGKAFKAFKLLTAEQGLQYPDVLSDMGVNANQILI